MPRPLHSQGSSATPNATGHVHTALGTKPPSARDLAALTIDGLIPVLLGGTLPFPPAPQVETN